MTKLSELRGLLRPDQVAQQPAPSLLLTFSIGFMDGWIKDEPEEVQRHWKRVREAAAGVIGIDPGSPEGDRCTTARLCPATRKLCDNTCRAIPCALADTLNAAVGAAGLTPKSVSGNSDADDDLDGEQHE